MKSKYYKFVIISALLLVAQISKVNAQGGLKCGTDEKMRELYASHPEMLQQQIDYNNSLTELIKNMKLEKTAEAKHIIPVVFHIIHCNGPENLPDANIYDAINVINTDWNKRNLDTSMVIGHGTANNPFDTILAKMNFEFRLATIDPNGNCTNGIDRIYSHLTYSADDNSKLNQWPRDKYLNIWVIHDFKTATSGVQPAAYALLPAGASGWMAQYDGVISLYDYIGSIAPSNGTNSRTLTHEIGHYFNLEHPWSTAGDITDPARPCGDDGVDDTPYTKGHLTCDKTPHCERDTIKYTYNFSSITPNSGTTDTANAPVNTFATLGQFSANGVSTSPIDSSRFSYTQWPTGGVNGDTAYANQTGAIDISKNYAFTVTPKWGHSMTPTSLTFDIKRNLTGAKSFVVRSSINGFASNLPVSYATTADVNINILNGNEIFYNKDTDLTKTGFKVTLSGTAYKDLLVPVTFKFYAWNAEDSTGSFSLDNVKLTDTVGLIEDYQNFMDYSYCDNHFTKGQKARVRAAAASPVSYRSNLWINSNLTATGTQDPYPTGVVCVPSPDFYSNRIQICAGSSVTFTAINSNVTQGSAVTRLWTFQNGTGTPTTSALASPTVTYTTPGDYDVTLALSSTSGTGTTTKSSYIHVYQPWAQYNGNLVENFESPSSSYWNWVLDNYDGNPHAWGLYSGAGYSGSHSMVMNGFDNYSDDIDDFITPGFNLYMMSGSTLSFRCAAASSALVASDLNDVLKVYASKDCGQTWTTMAGSTYQGTALCNNGYYFNSFFPTSPSQWALHTINISSSYNVPNLKFKFEYKTGNASNNIFIDDINVNGTVGIAENALAENNFSLYPNPSNETTTVFYHLNSKGNVKIEVMDVLGKKVMEIANTNQGEGDYYYNVSKLEHNLNNGIYFVKFTLDGNSTTKKLIFTQ